MKGPFLILSSPVVRFQHTFPALQSSRTINIFHLLEPSLPAQLVSFPSPTTYMVSQTFLSLLAGTPVGTVSPSLLPSTTSIHFLLQAVLSVVSESKRLENFWTLRTPSIFMPGWI